MRHVALLRGVNLGKRQVVMADLRAVCEAAGFTDVRTLLASGNVILQSKLGGAKLEATLENVIQEGLGLKTDVYVRTGAELDAMMAANPFKTFAKDNPTFLVGYFMRARLSAAERAALDAQDGPEEIKQGKNCLYIKFPHGQGPSKLKLPKLGTARNWNTVTKLAAAARGD
jgi:uncharacterized protein (DUF1697 family)